MSRESRNAVKSEERAERVPLGVKRKKLDVRERDPGFVYRWVNDVGGRIADAERGGYEFVAADVKAGESDVANQNSSTGDRQSKIVGKNESGKPITAFLMRIRKEWYESDQKTKQKGLDAVDAALKRGKTSGAAVDNSYIPAQGISISVEKGEEAA